MIITTQGDRRRKILAENVVNYWNARFHADGRLHKEQYMYDEINDLWLGITVTKIHSTGQDASDRVGELVTVSCPEVTLAQDLKDMFANPDNFSDLKLGTKDGVETSTHKFILAGKRLSLVITNTFLQKVNTAFS